MPTPRQGRSSSELRKVSVKLCVKLLKDLHRIRRERQAAAFVADDHLDSEFVFVSKVLIVEWTVQKPCEIRWQAHCARSSLEVVQDIWTFSVMIAVSHVVLTPVCPHHGGSWNIGWTGLLWQGCLDQSDVLSSRLCASCRLLSSCGWEEGCVCSVRRKYANPSGSEKVFMGSPNCLS